MSRRSPLWPYLVGLVAVPATGMLIYEVTERQKVGPNIPSAAVAANDPIDAAIRDARKAMNARDYDLAEAHINSVIQTANLERHKIEMARTLASIRYFKNEINAAIDMSTIVLQKEPGNIQNRIDRLFYRHAKLAASRLPPTRQDCEAIEVDARAVVDRQPNNGEAWLYLGESLALQHKMLGLPELKKEAISSLRQAIKLAPMNASKARELMPDDF